MDDALRSSGGEAVLAAFLGLYLEDLERDGVRSLAEYQARFPGYEEEIARELGALTAPPRADEALELSTVETFTGGGPRVGRLFGHYLVEELLGRGAQGSVWRAIDQRLGRPVALKVLSGAGMLSSDAIRRFRREGELAARLQHPHICDVYDSGIEDGLCYLAMRLVRGPSLAQAFEQRQAEGPPDAAWTQSVARFVEQIAEGLHYAHNAGVLHRDVKPGNILLDGGEHPVLADFGLAKDVMGDASLTAVDGQLGTPAYMSAEQLSGGRLPLDQRTDVFSLALVLYEGLGFQRAYDGLTLTVVGGRAIRPRPPGLARLNPHAKKDLRIVLAKAMAEERGDRYDTALAFADDLANVRLTRPIAARPAGPLLRLRRWARRSPVVALFTFALFASLAVTLGITMHFLAQARTTTYRTNFLLAAAESEDGKASGARAYLDACPEDLRGLEWRLLDARLAGITEIPVQRLERAVGLVHAGDVLTVTGKLGNWTQVDLESGAVRSARERSSGYGTSAIDATGRWLVSWYKGAGPPAFELALLPDGAPVRLPGVDAGQPHGLAVEPDGRVWRSSGGRLASWRAGEAAWTLVAPERPTGEPLTDLRVAPDGSYVAGLVGGRVRVVSVASGRRREIAAPTRWHVAAFALGPRGDVVTACAPDAGAGAVQLERWPAPSFEATPAEPVDALQRASWECGTPRALCVTSDGRVVLGAAAGTLIVLSADLTELVAEQRGHEQGPVAFASSGEALFALEPTGRTLRWELGHMPGERRFTSDLDTVASLVHDPSGRYLAAAHHSGAEVIDLETGARVLVDRTCGFGRVYWDAGEGCFLFHPGARDDGRALWLRLDGTIDEAIDPAFTSANLSDAVDPVRRRVLTWSSTDGFSWSSWETGVREPLPAWAGEPWCGASDFLEGLLYDWRRERLFGWAPGRGLEVLELRARRSALVEGGPRKALVASPDGRWLAGQASGRAAHEQGPGSEHEGARLVAVDLRSRRVLPWSVPIDGDVRSGAASPDGKLLAIGSTRGGVTLVQMPTGEVLLDLKTPGVAWSISFDPAGKTLAAGCLDGTVLVWDTGRP